MVPFLFYLFILKLDGFNITLGNTNVIYEYFIVTFGGFLIFFLLTLNGSNISQVSTIPTSHMTVLLSNLVVLFFIYFYTQIEWFQRHIG